MEAGRRHALGSGEDLDERVACPAVVGAACKRATPQIYDEVAVDIDGQRGAYLSTFGKVPSELVLDGPEARIAVAAYERLDLCRHLVSILSCMRSVGISVCRPMSS